MCRSVPPETLHGLVNPRPALLPFTLMMFLVWSVLCGEYRLLPLTALVMSFVAQTHFSMGWPAIGALAVLVAGLSVFSTRAPRFAPADTQARPTVWLLAALAVTLVCWSGPLLDQALHRPGNLVRIFQTLTANEKKFGLSVGWHAMVEATGGRPWWLRLPATGLLRLVDVLSVPSARAIFTWLLIVGGLLIAAVVGFRRGRRDLLTGAALAIVLEGTILVVAASTPRALGLQFEKSLLWTSPAGMFVWLAVGWAVVVLVGQNRWRPVAALVTMSHDRPLLPWLLQVAVMACVAVAVVIQMGPDDEAWLYKPVRQLTSRLTDRLPRNGNVLVSAPDAFSDFPMFSVQTALIYQLRKAGYRVLAPGNIPSLVAKLGQSYSSAGRASDRVLMVSYGNPPTGGRVLARVSLPAPGVRVEPTLAPSQRTFDVRVLQDNRGGFGNRVALQAP